MKTNVQITDGPEDEPTGYDAFLHQPHPRRRRHDREHARDEDKPLDADGSPSPGTTPTASALPTASPRSLERLLQCSVAVWSANRRTAFSATRRRARSQRRG